MTRDTEQRVRNVKIWAKRLASLNHRSNFDWFFFSFGFWIGACVKATFWRDKLQTLKNYFNVNVNCFLNYIFNRNAYDSLQRSTKDCTTQQTYLFCVPCACMYWTTFNVNFNRKYKNKKKKKKQKTELLVTA